MQNYWNVYLSCKQQQLYWPVNYQDFRETGPSPWIPIFHGRVLPHWKGGRRRKYSVPNNVFMNVMGASKKYEGIISIKIKQQTSESWSTGNSQGLDWGLLSTAILCVGSLTTCPTPPGVGSFLLVGVLCWELVGLFFGLTPPVMAFLAGEGDWVSGERTGIRDWLLASGIEGLRSRG